MNRPGILIKGESQDSCKGCGKPAGSKAPLETRAGDMVPLEEIRIPIVPSLAALDQKRLNPRLENINFGAILRLEDPSGNEMGAVFVGLNQGGGDRRRDNHDPYPSVMSYPIDQVVINTSWPRALLMGADPGVYKLSFWAQTADGLSSNKRFEYFSILN